MVNIISSILLFSFVFLQYSFAEEMYSDKYDNIAIEDILNNDKVREEYYNCFMDTGPCVTEDAAYFKGNFVEAMATQCKKCTQKQQENFEKVIVWYTENQPEKWQTLIQKALEDAKKLNIPMEATS
uniref:Chemosensory protein 4 n=1 Tax=Sclerodermus sp. MQW-2015 TaxID=1729718 RepID=A0A0N9JZS3_9HYME|nr:chemosensory protein 4 [Sclerodermus sp. MQW-2015]